MFVIIVFLQTKWQKNGAWVNVSQQWSYLTQTVPHNCLLGDTMRNELQQLEGNPLPTFGSMDGIFRDNFQRTRDLRVVFNLVKICIADHLKDNYLLCYALVVHITVLAYKYCKENKKAGLYKGDEYGSLCEMLLCNKENTKLLTSPNFLYRLYGEAHSATQLAIDLQHCVQSNPLAMDGLAKALARSPLKYTLYLRLTLPMVLKQANVLAGSGSSPGQLLVDCFESEGSPIHDQSITIIAGLVDTTFTQLYGDNLMYGDIHKLVKLVVNRGGWGFEDIYSLWLIFKYVKPTIADVKTYSELLKTLLLSRVTGNLTMEKAGIILAAAAFALPPEYLTKVFIVSKSIVNACDALNYARRTVHDTCLGSGAAIPLHSLNLAFTRHMNRLSGYSCSLLQRRLADDDDYGTKLLACHWLSSNPKIFKMEHRDNPVEPAQACSKFLDFVVSNITSDGAVKGGFTQGSKMLQKNLPKTICTIHNLLGCDVQVTSEFIRQSQYFNSARRAVSWRQDGLDLGTCLEIHGGSSSPIENAVAAIRTLSSCAMYEHSSAMVLWSLYCESCLVYLVPLFRGSETDVNQAIATLLEEIDNNLSIFHVMFIHIVLFATASGMKWIESQAHKLVRAIEGYCDEAEFCLANSSKEVYAKFVAHLQDFRAKLAQQQYTRLEYKWYAKNHVKINYMFDALGVECVADLPSWEGFEEQYVKVLRFLNWLAKYGVSDVDSEISRLKAQYKNERLQLCEVQRGVYTSNPFVTALNRPVSSLPGCTYTSLIQNVASNQSKLFNMFCRHHGQHRKDSAQWVNHVQNMVKNTLRDLRNLCLREMTLGTFKSVCGSLKDSDVAQEVDRLVQLRVPEARDAKNDLIDTLSIIGYIEDQCASDILGMLKVIKCDVMEYEGLRNEVSAPCVSHSRSLGDICQSYKWLRTLLKCLNGNHFQFFKEIASGRCQKIIDFFRKHKCFTVEGRREYEKLLENLDMKTHHSSQSKDILMALTIALDMFSPLMSDMDGVRDVSSVLKKVAKVGTISLSSIRTVCSSASEIDELFLMASGDFLGEITTRLSRLSTSGHLRVQLCTMAGSKSTYSLELDERSGKTQTGTTSMSITADEIGDFRNQLQYFKPSRMTSIPRTASDKGNVEELAIKFLAILQQIYKILDLCFRLEMEGHPTFQQRCLWFSLVNSSLDTDEKYLTDALAQWQHRLREARQSCPALHLLSNQSIGVVSALLVGKVVVHRLVPPVSVQQPNAPNSPTPNPPTDHSGNYNNGLSASDDVEMDLLDVRQGAVRMHLAHATECSVHLTGGDIVHNYLSSLHPVVQWKNSCNPASIIKPFLQRREETQESEVYTAIDDLVELIKCTMEVRHPSGTDSGPNKQTMYSLEGEEDGSLNFWLLLCMIYEELHESSPCRAQILFCSQSTSVADVQQFFERVEHFHWLVFTMFAVDRLGIEERLELQHQQQLLNETFCKTATVFYTCHCSRVFASWPTIGLGQKRLPTPSVKHLSANFQTLANNKHVPRGSSRNPVVFRGKPGCGKSHTIKKRHLALKNGVAKGDSNSKPNGCSHVTISIRDSSNVNTMIRKIANCSQPDALLQCTLAFDSDWFEVNKILFQIVYCGTLQSPDLPIQVTFLSHTLWKWYIEVAQTASMSRIENNLPVVHVAASIQDNPGSHLLDIDDGLEQLAAIVDAYQRNTLDTFESKDKKISRCLDKDIVMNYGVEKAQSLLHIFISKHINVQKAESDQGRALLTNRLFVAYFRERVRWWFYKMDHFRNAFLDGHYASLGRTLMEHIILECIFMCSRPLLCSWSDADQIFCVSSDKQYMFTAMVPPRAQHTAEKTQLKPCKGLSKDVLRFPPFRELEPAVVLAQAFELEASDVRSMLEERKFVLTRNFAFKLLLIHRHVCANRYCLNNLPLIMEGETGVGKTSLLEFYTKLLSIAGTKEKQKQLQDALRRRATTWLSELVTNEDGRSLDKLQALGKAWYNQLKGSKLTRYLRANADSAEELVALWKQLIETGCGSEQQQLAIRLLVEKVTVWMKEYKNEIMVSKNDKLMELMKKDVLTAEDSEQVLRLWLNRKYAVVESFFKLLVHPGVDKESLREFLRIPQKVASQVTPDTVVVFLDEINTASCLGLFKEVFMDRTLDGTVIGDNIFFVAAVNPHTGRRNQPSAGIHPPAQKEPLSSEYTRHYDVHELPIVMDGLKFKFKSMIDVGELKEYIAKKVELLGHIVASSSGKTMSFRDFSEAMRDVFVNFIIYAQNYFKIFVDRSDDEVASVSQRDIQRVFILVPYFWKVLEILKGLDEEYGEYWSPDETFLRCIYLAVAVVYYFRLPIEPPSAELEYCRHHFEDYLLKKGGSDDYKFLDDTLKVIDRFVTRKHFILPNGTALTTALKENIFCMISCIETRIPFAIVGQPGSSKSLSYQIVNDNMRGEYSLTSFCKRFTPLETFFYQGSEHSTANEIGRRFDRAKEYQSGYDQNHSQVSISGHTKHCVVFLEEAGLPMNDKAKLALKVFHQYLDENRVAFVALSNTMFDAANANRMVIVCRSLPTEKDLEELAVGCVFPENKQIKPPDNDMSLLRGLCQGYEKITRHQEQFAGCFHHRDLIHLLRYFQRVSGQEGLLVFSRNDLIRGLEETFGGVKNDDFKILCMTFIDCVASELRFPEKWISGEWSFRNVFEVLSDIKKDVDENTVQNMCEVEHRTMAKDGSNVSSNMFLLGSSLSPRFHMIIDETDNDTAALDTLFHLELLNPSDTHVFHLSTLPKDRNSSEYLTGVLSDIEHCLELPHTTVLVNAEPIYGSLYELLNNSLRLINGRLYVNISTGANTRPCRIHPRFKLVVIVKHSFLQSAPAPLRSRFSKFLVHPKDAVDYVCSSLTEKPLAAVMNVINRSGDFMKRYHHTAFLGMCSGNRRSEDELSGNFYVFLLSLFRRGRQEQHASEFQFTPFTGSPLNARCLQHIPLQCDVRAVCARLIQLMPSEHFVLRLDQLRDADVYFKMFFDMDRFDLGSAIKDLCMSARKLSPGSLCNKCLIYTRSTSLLATLANPNMTERVQPLASQSPEVDIVNVETCKTASACQEHVERFLKSKMTCQMFVVNSSQEVDSSTLFNVVKCCIDATDVIMGHSSKLEIQRKSFVIIMHCLPFVPGHHITPAQFLRGWQSLFLDLSSATHDSSSNGNHFQQEMKAMAQACLQRSASRSPAVVNGESVQIIDDNEAHVKFLELLNVMKPHLVNEFCSNLQSISTLDGHVSNLPAECYKDFFGNSADVREKALHQILNECPAIISTVAKRVSQRFSGGRILSIMFKLSRTVTQHRTYLSFADLLHEYVLPEIAGVFRKVLTDLCTGFSIVSLAQLPEVAQMDLLELIPSFEPQDEASYRQEKTVSINCYPPLFIIPLYSCVKKHVASLLHSGGTYDDVFLMVSSDPILQIMQTDIDLVQSFITDYIQALCSSRSDQNDVNIAKKYLQLACSLPQDDSLSEPSHVLASFLFQIHDAEAAVRMITLQSCAMARLTTSGKSISDLLDENDSMGIETGDEFLVNFCNVFFKEIWASFVGLSEDQDEDSWYQHLAKWKSAYVFVRQITSAAPTVSVDSVSPTTARNSEHGIKDAVNRSIHRHLTKLHLLKIAGVVLNHHQIVKRPEVPREMIAQIAHAGNVCREGHRLLKPIAAVLKLAKERCGVDVARALKLDLLLALVSTIEKVQQGDKRLDYLITCINSAEGDEVMLSTSCSIYILQELVRPSNGYQQSNNSHLDGYMKPLNVLAEVGMTKQKVVLCNSLSTYYPQDFPELSEAAEARATVLSAPFVHALYQLLLKFSRQEKMSFERRVSQALNRSILVPPGGLPVFTSLQLASSSRLVFECFVDRLISGRVTPSDVRHFDSLHKVYGGLPEWKGFLLSELTLRGGVKSLLTSKMLGNEVLIDSKWKATLLEELNTEEIEMWSHRYFVDHGFNGPFETCSKILHSLTTSRKSDKFRDLHNWHDGYVQQEHGDTFHGFERSGWCNLILVHTVFVEYCCQGRTEFLNGMSYALHETRPLSQYMHLLLNGNTDIINGIKETFSFTAGQKPTPCCTLVVNWLALLLCGGRMCGFYYSLSTNPAVVLPTFVPGAVRNRACVEDIHQLRRGLDWQNTADVSSTICDSLCRLTQVGRLVSALWSYISLFCYLVAILERDDISSFSELWFLLVDTDEIHRLDVCEVRSRLVDSCFRHINCIIATIQQSNNLFANEQDTVDFVLVAMKYFLQKIPDLELPEKCSSATRRQIVESDLQAIIDVALVNYKEGAVDKLQKCINPSIQPFLCNRPPVLKVCDLADVLVRHQTDAIPKFPLLASVINLFPALQCVKYATNIARLYFMLCRAFSHHISHSEFFEDRITIGRAANKYLRERKKRQLLEAVDSAKQSVLQLNSLKFCQAFEYSTALFEGLLDIDNTPLCVLSGSLTGDKCQHGGGLLANIIAQLLQVNNNLLKLCSNLQADKSSGSYDALSVLPPNSLVDRVPMADVCAYKGVGLIHIGSNQLQRLVNYHSVVEKSAAGEFRTEFDLCAIEQSLVHQFIAEVRSIDWERSRETFYITDKPPSESLIDNLCPEFTFDEVLPCKGKRRHLKARLQGSSSYEIISTMRHLSIISVKVVETLKSRELSSKKTIHSFIAEMSLQHACWSVQELVQEPIHDMQLGHIPEIYRQCSSALSGVDSLFNQLPALLKIDIEPVLITRVRKVLQQFYDEKYASLEPEALSEILDNMSTFLLGNVDIILKQRLDVPLAETLKEGMVRNGTTDCLKMLENIPKDVSGGHLKEFLTLLLQFSVKARERLVNSSPPYGEKWAESESCDTDQLRASSFTENALQYTNPGSHGRDDDTISNTLQASGQFPYDLPVRTLSQNTLSETLQLQFEYGASVETLARNENGSKAANVKEVLLSVGYRTRIPQKHLQEVQPAVELQTKSGKLKGSCLFSNEEKSLGFVERKKVLEKSCQLFELSPKEGYCLTDTDGCVLHGNEVPAQKNGTFQFNLVPCTSVISIQLLHVGYKDEPVVVEFSERSSCTSVCDVGLQKHGYRTACLAALCTTGGQVLTGESLEEIEGVSQRKLELILCSCVQIEVYLVKEHAEASQSVPFSKWVAPLCTAEDVITLATSHFGLPDDCNATLAYNGEDLDPDDTMQQYADALGYLNPLSLQLMTRRYECKIRNACREQLYLNSYVFNLQTVLFRPLWTFQHDTEE